jgi:glycosyltransferase involved in cell wall biosynthesis
MMRIALALPRGRGRPFVCYGDLPFGKGGPLTKLELLRQHFPEHRWRFNVFYLLSGGTADFGLVARAKERGAKVVLNQDGVYYPAVRPGDWEAANEPMRRMLSLADYVFYQSEYARLAAERFLGKPDLSTGKPRLSAGKPRLSAGKPAVGSEVLYNAVDTALLKPASRRREGPFALLSTALLTNELRIGIFAHLLEALRILKSRRTDWRFVLATRLDAGEAGTGLRARVLERVEELGLSNFAVLGRPFARTDAVATYQQGDVYLHNMYNDCCPNGVLEAMACGLPVVYSATGGTPELVGAEAGIGVACPLDWERVHAPEPELYAGAISEVMDAYDGYSRAARERAVAKFDVKPWIKRHEAVFRQLLLGGSRT